VPAIAPLLFLIEIISHMFRPLTLSVRLAGNMTADHTVLSTFIDLTKVVIPVIFYGLGTFVSFIQAFVFTMLTMLYIGLATAHEEH
jgi:F-type H+-transporting ATPase subunit a